ncbi:MAG: penicillin-binding protein activator [Myxococcota bacterium]
MTRVFCAAEAGETAVEAANEAANEAADVAVDAAEAAQGRSARSGSAWSLAARTAALLVMLLLLSLSGCALPGLMSTPSVPLEEQSLFDAALSRRTADPRAARAGLEAFLETYPRSLLAGEALENLAQVAFAEGRNEEGRRLLGRVISEHPTSDRIPSVRLQLAEANYARNDRREARETLAALDLGDLSDSQRMSALRLRVALAQTPVERFKYLSMLRDTLRSEISRGGLAGGRDAAPVASVATLQRRLDAVENDLQGLIASAATPELEEMMRGLRGRSPAAQVGLELSRRALDAGQFDLAAKRLGRTESLLKTDAEYEAYDLLQRRLASRVAASSSDAELPPLRQIADSIRPSTAGARGTVGVVLPLSGSFADYGEQSLRGILLASNVFSGDAGAGGAGSDGKAIRIVVRDSEGDPATAAAAVRELASDPSVMAIVGPIFSDESLAAADAAEGQGVPLVTLSTREALSEGRPQVFRTRTTPGDEVEVLVEHAFNELGAQTFAVLYPESRYGRGMRKLYWDAVVARGGQMVAASSYDPASTDFSGPVRDMIGYRFLTNWERKALRERDGLLRAIRVLKPQEQALVRKAAYSLIGPELVPLPPVVDFDVLFIPDGADSVAMIAPALAFHEVKGIRLLGSSDWVDEELLRVARHHVSGSVISTAFYAESDVSVVSEFVGAFTQMYGETPDAYAAQAFDAANLVFVQMATGFRDRESIRSGLLDTRAYPGATGTLTMRSSGNARRRPFLLGVSRGRFESLD